MGLGYLVVSEPGKQHGGVVQYNYGMITATGSVASGLSEYISSADACFSQPSLDLARKAWKLYEEPHLGDASKVANSRVIINVSGRGGKTTYASLSMNMKTTNSHVEDDKDYVLSRLSRKDPRHPLTSIIAHLETNSSPSVVPHISMYWKFRRMYRSVEYNYIKTFRNLNSVGYN